MPGSGSDPWTATWETSWGYYEGNQGTVPTVTAVTPSATPTGTPTEGAGTGAGMGGYQVSGAGTAAVNGVYTPNGNTHNGEPVYAFVNGDTTYYLYYQVNDENEYAWTINNSVTDSPGPEFMGYYQSGTITGAWTNSNMWPSGATPAPTVTGTPAA